MEQTRVIGVGAYSTGEHPGPGGATEQPRHSQGEQGSAHSARGGCVTSSPRPSAWSSVPMASSCSRPISSSPTGSAIRSTCRKHRGGVRLSDRGDTLMRISYDHDIDAFLAGSRGQLIERILGEEEVGQDRGVFHLDAPIDRLSDALFRYGRALTRIYDLTLHSRSRATSTFYDDLADLLSRRPTRNGFSVITCFRTFRTPRHTRSTIGWRGRAAGRFFCMAFRIGTRPA